MKKKENNKDTRTGSSPLAVTAILVEPRMLKNLVEELAERRYAMDYNLEKLMPGWQADDTSSIEAYLSGDIVLSNSSYVIDMPFDTGFLFTCLKEKSGKYGLTWASSLS